MKAGRLVAMLLTLQQRRGATAAELARLLEVSERTVYRDVEALQSAGWRWLHRVTEPAAGESAVCAVGDADAHGWREVELAVKSPEVALHQILVLGDGVEVLDPPELRAALARVGAAMADRNR